MDYDCFLSHNGRDKPAVRALCERLQAAGLAVWLDDNDLPFGEAMRNEFAGRVADTPLLADLFNQGVHWLEPPDRLARRDMILGPARRAGLRLEGGEHRQLPGHAHRHHQRGRLPERTRELSTSPRQRAP